MYWTSTRVLSTVSHTSGWDAADTPNRGERPGPQWHCVWQRSGTVWELSRAWERHGVRLHAAVCEAAFVLLTRTRTHALRVATDLVKMDQLIYNSEHKRTLSS